jgi:DNA (cytosine-5)-methyltransferase 1
VQVIRSVDHPPRAVDLFCGCGGMSLGFENAGFEIVAAYDNWEPALRVYQDNFSHDAYLLDLSVPSAAKIIAAHEPDVIFGGPPCQDFSSAGTSNHLGKRASLTAGYAEIVFAARPQFFVLENVPRIAHSAVFHKVCEQFEAAGYGLTQVVLDASYCGVPQSRKRLFLIGGLGENADFMNAQLIRDLAPMPLTMRQHFGESLGMDHYFRIPTNYSKRAVFSIDEPCRTIRAVDRPIPPTYRQHPADSRNVADNVRALTVRERGSVQTFPQDFKFVGSKTNLNHMIGNAVPVKLAEYVAKILFEYMVSKKHAKKVTSKHEKVR